jgi:superfamily II DNA or RNA helicase
MNITFDADKNKAVLKCSDSNLFEYIRHHFSIENKAKKFIKNKLKARHMPSRLYAITPTGLFEPGMADEIRSFAAAEQLASEVMTTPLFDNLYGGKIQTSVFEHLNLTLRDYQSSAVQHCINNGRGICVLGTGAGKTLITASLACSLLHCKSNVLILVPDPGLADQTYNDFLSYGVTSRMCLWTGTTPDLDASAQIIIANHDIVLSRFENYEWLKDVDALIVDEVHTIKKNNSITKIIDKIQTKNKFGFTGTLPVDELDLWCVLGKIGKVLMTKSSAELRQQQVLTNAKVSAIHIIYKNNPQYIVRKEDSDESMTENYRKELEFIYNNEYRNRVITQICKNYDNNILILINHLQHGECLYNALQQCVNKQVIYINGETSLEQRNAGKQLLETCNNVVCIAMSSIFSTGINIKNLHMIVFAAGGKSFIRVVQSIGRGLRKAQNKQLLTIIDIVDNLRYGIRHHQQRIKIYETEKFSCTQTKLVEN